MVTKSILSCFELASGLKVNFSKNRLGGVGINQSQLQLYSSLLNYEIMKAHFKYLGLEVASNHIRVCFWEDVIDKIKKRLDR